MLKNNARDLPKDLADIKQLLSQKKEVLQVALEQKAQEAIQQVDSGSYPSETPTLSRLRKKNTKRSKLNTSKGSSTRSASTKKSAARSRRRSKASAGAGSAVKNLFLTSDQEWIDPSMVDWPDDDYRIYAGNLGNEINDENLAYV